MGVDNRRSLFNVFLKNGNISVEIKFMAPVGKYT